MIIFNIGFCKKGTENGGFFQIKTNGLEFWTLNDENKFINPFWNTPERKEIFKLILDETEILTNPKNFMVCENEHYHVTVLSADV